MDQAVHPAQPLEPGHLEAVVHTVQSARPAEPAHMYTAVHTDRAAAAQVQQRRGREPHPAAEVGAAHGGGVVHHLALGQQVARLNAVAAAEGAAALAHRRLGRHQAEQRRRRRLQERSMHPVDA